MKLAFAAFVLGGNMLGGLGFRRASQAKGLTRALVVAPLAALTLSLTPVLPVQAAALTVCASGCDQPTIAAAIAAASAGDTISVLDALHGDVPAPVELEN